MKSTTKDSLTLSLIFILPTIPTLFDGLVRSSISLLNGKKIPLDVTDTFLSVDLPLIIGFAISFMFLKFVFKLALKKDKKVFYIKYIATLPLLYTIYIVFLELIFPLLFDKDAFAGEGGLGLFIAVPLLFVITIVLYLYYYFTSKTALEYYSGKKTE